MGPDTHDGSPCPPVSHATMPMIQPASIRDLKSRVNIVDVVSGVVTLRKAGASFKGLCPFHNEKTPSFVVSPSKGVYKCFGCGKGGGVINFIMEIENLSFPDAVAFLAKRANMPMPQQEDSAETRKRERMLALNRDAAVLSTDYTDDGIAAEVVLPRDMLRKYAEFIPGYREPKEDPGE